jgi:hypothetical protein
MDPATVRKNFAESVTDVQRRVLEKLAQSDRPVPLRALIESLTQEGASDDVIAEAIIELASTDEVELNEDQSLTRTS